MAYENSHTHAGDVAPAEAFDPLDVDEYYRSIRVRRAIAFVIDFIVIGILMGVLTATLAVFGVIAIFMTFGLAQPLVVLALSLVPFTYIAYHTLMIGSSGNATIGMRIMGIRVLCWNGNTPSYAQAAIQTILFYVSISITSFVVLLLSFLNDRGRCLHDYLSGCVVINDIPQLPPHGAQAVNRRPGSAVRSR
jgi:uncharacterized RDD family membrane protein YckC